MRTGSDNFEDKNWSKARLMAQRGRQIYYVRQLARVERACLSRRAQRDGAPPEAAVQGQPARLPAVTDGRLVPRTGRYGCSAHRPRRYRQPAISWRCQLTAAAETPRLAAARESKGHCEQMAQLMPTASSQRATVHPSTGRLPLGPVGYECSEFLSPLSPATKYVSLPKQAD